MNQAVIYSTMASVAGPYQGPIVLPITCAYCGEDAEQYLDDPGVYDYWMHSKDYTPICVAF